MEYPEWVMQQKQPGTSIKRIGNNYYLYYATSKYVKDKPYPVSVQTYIGKITEDGVISERVSINVGKTQASTLGELLQVELPEELQGVIVLKIKGDWLYTRLSRTQKDALERRGLYESGKVNV